MNIFKPKSKALTIAGLGTQSKEQQLGERPSDVEHGEPREFSVMLKHGMPQVRVKAHYHTFGGSEDGSPGSYAHGMPQVRVKAHYHTFGGSEDCSPGSYTHFYLRMPTTWEERVEQKCKPVYDPHGRRINEVYLNVWTWVRVNNKVKVFSIRTDDIVMVREACCVKPEEDVDE